MESNRNSWLVGYTLPHCERTLQLKLQQCGIECFLPMRREMRTWTDRTKWIDVPVFPNYIFIRTSFARRWEHLKFRELVKYVTFNDQPATIKEDEIALLQLIQYNDPEATIVPRQRIPPGTAVIINSGRFAGAKGRLVREADRSKVVVELTAVNHLINLHVDVDQVSPEWN